MIHENQIADINAKAALNHKYIDLEIPTTVDDIKKEIDNHIISQWQRRFNSSITGADYRMIEPIVSRRIKFTCNNRQKERCITRLRLGKCCLNRYLHTMNIHPDGLCAICRVPETIEHSLLNCRGNKDLIEKIKTFCRAEKKNFCLKSIFENNCCTEYIANYFNSVIKRKI